MSDEYDHMLLLSSYPRDGEGEGDITLKIMLQDVLRYDITSLTPGGAYGDGRVGSATSSRVTVDARELGGGDLSALRAVCFELIDVGVTSLFYTVEIVSDIVDLVGSMECPGPDMHPVLFVYVKAVMYEDDDDLVRAITESLEEASLWLEKVRFGEATAEQCVVCLEEFEEGEEVTCMPCKHVYHGECIVKWLHTSHMCPICRFQLPRADSVG